MFGATVVPYASQSHNQLPDNRIINYPTIA